MLPKWFVFINLLNLAWPGVSIQAGKFSKLYLSLGAPQLRVAPTTQIDTGKSPFLPAPLTLEGAPPPRKLHEVEQILGTALKNKKNKKLTELRIVLCSAEKDPSHTKIGLHDYPLWQSRWTRLLNMGQHVEAEPAIHWPSPEQWQNADLIVFNSYNPSWSLEKDSLKLKERGQDLEQFLARGGGLVFIHFALNAGSNALNAQALANYTGLALHRGQTRYRQTKEWILDSSHPLAKGFDTLQIPDECYWNFAGNLDSGAKVLANNLQEGSMRPQMWTLEQGAGRVFVSVPGHHTWTFDDPLYRILIFRGMMWAVRQPMDRLAPLSILGARVEP